MKKVLSFSLLAVATAVFISGCTTVVDDPAPRPVTTTTTESHTIKAY